MKAGVASFALLAGLICVSPLSGQVAVNNLQAQLDAGWVTLTSARGNGFLWGVRAGYAG